MNYNKLIVTVVLPVLLALICILWFKYWKVSQQVYEERYAAGTLSEDLASKIQLLRNRVVITYRSPEKKEVVVKKMYVPSEGKVDILQPKPSSKVSIITKKKSFGHTQFEIPGTSGTVVDVKDVGLTFKPGLGVLYDYDLRKLFGELDVKFFYWRRFSTMVFTSVDFGGFAVSYHIDQLFPEKISPQNVELAVFGGISYHDWSEKRLYLGLRTNF